MKTKNIDDYYTEELERHNFQILDHSGPGKCSKHAPCVTKCKGYSGKISKDPAARII